MKYKFRRLNCVQETDSEDRKNELLQKGFVLESEDGKPVKNTGTSKGNKDLEKENASLKKRVEALEKENVSLKETVEALEKEKVNLKKDPIVEADQDAKGKKNA